MGLSLVLCHHLPHVLPDAVAALPKFIWQSFERAWIFIELFFVISGFIIADVYYRAVERSPESAFRRFYVSRFLKVFPAYFLVLAIYIWIDGELFGKSWIRYLVFVQNFDYMPSFVHSWSLCVEEHFYLFFPLSIFLIRKRSGYKWLALALVCIIIISNFYLWQRADSHFVQRSAMAQLESPDPWLAMLETFYFPTIGHLQSFAAGVLIAIGVRYSAKFREGILKYSKILFVGGWLSMCAIAFFADPRTVYWVCIYVPFLSMLSCTMLVASCCVSEAWSNRLRFGWMEYVSMSSYSIYLVHMLAYRLVLYVSDSSGVFFDKSTLLLIALVVAYVMGILLYEVFEKPIYQLRARWI